MIVMSLQNSSDTVWHHVCFIQILDVTIEAMPVRDVGLLLWTPLLH